MATKTKRAPKPEIPPVERLTCVQEVRVGGVHYFPGDTAPVTDELRESGAFA